MRTSIIFIFIGILLTVSLVNAQSQSPTESIRKPVEQVLAILNDPQYQSEDKKAAQRERLWETTLSMFDFTEIAKRTLARNWLNFNPEQRKAFRDTFARLLTTTYTNKIQGNYSNEKVVFTDEEVINETKAMVKSNVLRQDVEIPVNYSLKRGKEGWRIYDVKVEGISLVQNYRTQFNKYLKEKTPDQLIEELDRKVAEQKSAGTQQ
jgi:phospholipid transport system substrate-binding protein